MNVIYDIIRVILLSKTISYNHCTISTAMRSGMCKLTNDSIQVIRREGVVDKIYEFVY